MIKRSKGLVALSAACAVLFSCLQVQAAFGEDSERHDDDRVYVKRKCVKKDEAAKSEDPLQNNSAPANGSWTRPGTEAYKVAKEIFDTLTGTYGTSGAFAAGVIGNLVGESTFIPDAAEVYDSHNKRQSMVTGSVEPAGRQGGVLRFGMNQKKPVNGMAKYDGKMLGGGGLFQFTPYTKFSDSSYWQKLKPEGWAAANQVAYVMDVDVLSRRLEPYMTSSGGQQFGASLYGKPVRFSKTEQLLSAEDPRIAAEVFYVSHLRGAVYHPEREDHAAKAYEIFKGSGVKADPSKWSFTDGASTGDGTNIAPVKNDSSDDEKECETENEDMLWADFVGEHGLSIPAGYGKFFKKNDLPSNLSRYLINPESIGIGFGDCAAWTKYSGNSNYLNGQCVALSKVLFNHIWSKNGQPGPSFFGNGVALAESAAKAWGGKVSKTPSKGALASITTSDAAVGHTFIVSHVFANGDILLVEQNINGYSGSNNGEKCNWNYRIQTKAGYESQNAKFFSPKDIGGVVNPTLKSRSVTTVGATGALATALSKAGSKYVYGQTGPNAFDCSGLTSWAFGQNGVHLPRTASGQYGYIKRKGKLKTNFDSCQRGDLVFWKHGGSIDHVGFYVGNDRIFHASTPQTGVLEAPVYDKSHIVGCGQP